MLPSMWPKADRSPKRRFMPPIFVFATNIAENLSIGRSSVGRWCGKVFTSTIFYCYYVALFLVLSWFLCLLLFFLPFSNLCLLLVFLAYLRSLLFKPTPCALTLSSSSLSDVTVEKARRQREREVPLYATTVPKSRRSASTFDVAKCKRKFNRWRW